MPKFLREKGSPTSSDSMKPPARVLKQRSTRPWGIPRRVTFLQLAALAFVAGSACMAADGATLHAAGDCGDVFKARFGPFDYRTATPEQKHIVEIYHFTPEVEALQSGVSAPVGGELDYTLRAFPNHPRALMALVRLGQRDKTTKPTGAGYSVECFVERAIAFRPDDTAIRQIRGIYYSMQRKYELAIADFTKVIEQQPDNANAHYNLGLAYFQTGNYDGAQAEAKLAQELGFPLEGLRNMLRAKGKWSE